MYDDPQQFPLDLIVKRTVAYIRLKEDNHALAQVGLQFLAETEDASTVSDLFLEVGKAYEHIRKFEVAIAYFNKVAMFMDKVAFFFFFFWFHCSSFRSLPGRQQHPRGLHPPGHL